MLDPEWLCCAHNVLSVGNYLRRWRPKVANEVSGDALFLKPDGRPFPSKFALAKFVKDRVRKVAPWFSFRMARRWCATARIIDSGFSYYEVSRWLGHESVEMLRNHYDQDARFHERLHSANWLYRAFHGGPRRAGGRVSTDPRKVGSLVHAARAKVSAPVGMGA
jgi:hypothetical protein